MLADLALIGCKIFHKSNLIAVHRKQTNVVLNKPIYVGTLILDLNLLIIEIETEDVYADMVEDADDLYDFSDYSEDHLLLEKLLPDQWVILHDSTHELKNKKVIGKWKDEFAGIRALRYIEN
ncbi:hypothetical protein RclHR1_08070014 [Rhizophagus clarus]|uniref:Uncharacterized protein n=1 Tax=Rhizophagus clarus TaxID=94130 RepID=A0A2Z6SE71_9GLOM|nr:hypothetical protein RclHR1_08070014 [Rhizophagus clarus]